MLPVPSQSFKGADMPFGFIYRLVDLSELVYPCVGLWRLMLLILLSSLIFSPFSSNLMFLLSSAWSPKPLVEDADWVLRARHYPELLEGISKSPGNKSLSKWI